MAEPKVRLTGLSKFDVKEFGSQEGVRFEEVAVPKGSHGEVTLFTALFAMSALATLAAWLLRKHDNKSFEETVEIVHPDGRIEKRKIKYKATKTSPPEAEIIKQLQANPF